MEITNPAAKRHAKMLVFSPPGHGKTHLLGTAQEDERTSPMLLLDFEGGDESLAGLDIDVMSIRAWSDYDEAYELLSSEDHSTFPGSTLPDGGRYRSVGLDSTSETHIWALLQILDKNKVRRNEPDLIEQGDYGIASTQMRRLLREFRDLPLHIFYTSTSKEIKERRVGQVKVPALAGQMSEEIVSLVSVAGYLAKSVNDDDEEERILILQNYPGFRTKVRTKWFRDAPDEIINPTITSLLDALEITMVPPGTADEYEAQYGLNDEGYDSDGIQGDVEGDEPDEEPDNDESEERAKELYDDLNINTKRKLQELLDEREIKYDKLDTKTDLINRLITEMI